MQRASAKTQDTFQQLLDTFRTKALASVPVLKLIKRWERTVAIRILDQPGAYILKTHNGTVAPIVLQHKEHAKADVTIAATQAVLAAVFNGTLNPARAHLDGDLQVFGSQRDHLVLDALVMLIWGY